VRCLTEGERILAQAAKRDSVKAALANQADQLMLEFVDRLGLAFEVDVGRRASWSLELVKINPICLAVFHLCKPTGVERIVILNRTTREDAFEVGRRQEALLSG
jgi:hypothetical protein